jgi:hypothetical protein
VKTGYNLVGSCKEGYGSNSSVLPVMIMIMMLMAMMMMMMMMMMRLEISCMYNDYVVYKAAEENTQVWNILL